MADSKLPQETPHRQPTDTQPLTVCARCPKTPERGSHLCADCTQLARFETSYKFNLERRAGYCGQATSLRGAR